MLVLFHLMFQEFQISLVRERPLLFLMRFLSCLMMLVVQLEVWFIRKDRLTVFRVVLVIILLQATRSVVVVVVVVFCFGSARVNERWREREKMKSGAKKEIKWRGERERKRHTISTVLIHTLFCSLHLILSHVMKVIVCCKMMEVIKL